MSTLPEITRKYGCLYGPKGERLYDLEAAVDAALENAIAPMHTIWVDTVPWVDTMPKVLPSVGPSRRNLNHMPG